MTKCFSHACQGLLYFWRNIKEFYEDCLCGTIKFADLMEFLAKWFLPEFLLDEDKLKIMIKVVKDDGNGIYKFIFWIRIIE